MSAIAHRATADPRSPIPDPRSPIPDPTQQGYQKWQQELDARKKEIESRYGIILGKPVLLTLTGENKALQGILTIANTRRHARDLFDLLPDDGSRFHLLTSDIHYSREYGLHPHPHPHPDLTMTPSASIL